MNFCGAELSLLCFKIHLFIVNTIPSGLATKMLRSGSIKTSPTINTGIHFVNTPEVESDSEAPAVEDSKTRRRGNDGKLDLAGLYEHLWS